MCRASELLIQSRVEARCLCIRRMCSCIQRDVFLFSFYFYAAFHDSFYNFVNVFKLINNDNVNKKTKLLNDYFLQRYFAAYFIDHEIKT